MGRVQGIVQILDVEFDSEAGLEVVGHHHGGFRVHHGGACQPAPDCLIDQLRVRAALHRQRQCFRDCGNIDCHDHLVCQLGHISGAQGAYIYNGTGHCHQEVIIFVKIFLRAARHHGKRAVDGLGFPAADRRVHHVDILLRQLCPDGFGLYRVNGTHVDHDRTRFCCFQDSLFSQADLPHMGGIGKHGDDHLAFGRHVRRAVRRFSPKGRHFLYTVTASVADHQFITCLDQVFAHRFSHNSKSDKSNFHFDNSPLLFNLLQVSYTRAPCVYELILEKKRKNFY